MQRAICAQPLLAALLLAGCGSLPLTSIAPLARIDAQTTDLSMLRVAVQLPEFVRPRSGGVRLDVIVKISGAEDAKTSFALVEAGDMLDRSGLPSPPPGFSTYVYRLTPPDAVRFDSLRASIYAQRGSGKHGSVGMGVATKEFCRVGDARLASLPVTTYLMTSETRGYVAITRDLDLVQDSQMVAGLSALPDCGS